MMHLYPEYCLLSGHGVRLQFHMKPALYAIVLRLSKKSRTDSVKNYKCSCYHCRFFFQQYRACDTNNPHRTGTMHLSYLKKKKNKYWFESLTMCSHNHLMAHQVFSLCFVRKIKLIYHESDHYILYIISIAICFLSCLSCSRLFFFQFLPGSAVFCEMLLEICIDSNFQSREKMATNIIQDATCLNGLFFQLFKKLNTDLETFSVAYV